MTVMDAQIGFKAESTFGTPVTVDKFIEFTSETLRPNYQLLAAASRRPGQPAVRSDRTARPGLIGLTGAINFEPLTKGFGAIVKQAFGSVSTAGPTDSAYTHTFTATAGGLTGVSSTIQVGRPSTDGTVRPFTYAGCKTAGLSLSSSLDGILQATWSIAHATAEATATSLASASYASSATVFTYAGGALTVDATAVPITQCSVNLTNSLKMRRMLGNGAGLEPLENGDRQVSCQFTAEFTDLTLLNKVRATTAAGGQAAVVMSWTGPTLIGTTTYPSITVTLPVVDITGDYAFVSGPDLVMMPMSGIARWNGTTLISLEYVTLDSTP